MGEIGNVFNAAVLNGLGVWRHMWEAEIRRLPQVQSQPGLHGEVQASLDCRVRTCLKIKQNKRLKY